MVELVNTYIKEFKYVPINLTNLIKDKKSLSNYWKYIKPNVVYVIEKNVENKKLFETITGSRDDTIYLVNKNGVG
jgi:hypothetical protein